VHFIKRDEIDERKPARLAARIAAAADDGSLPGMSERRYDLDAGELASTVGCSWDQLRALIGHLQRAGVVQPSPAPPERVAGELVGAFEGRAEALCRASIAEAARVRWRQYREIWAYVESADCRRRTILRHFGDTAEPFPSGPCCDACGAEGLVPELPAPDPGSVATLDDAILSVARAAKPSVGRTTCAEILHGARTKKIARNSYDGLPAYGTSSNMRRADILHRIDELIQERRLLTSEGPYPVLRPAPATVAA
jgi:ATP-dependent DNA helicase RecQ